MISRFLQSLSRAFSTDGHRFVPASERIESAARMEVRFLIGLNA